MADRRPDLPGHVGHVIARCLEKHPNDRIQTARDVHNELKALWRDHSSEWPSSSSRLAEHHARETQTPSSSSVRAAGFLTAVLPFAHRGSDPDLEALAEGLTEDITAGLSRFPYLRVMARQSTIQAVAQPDAQRAARQIGAR